jgi:hypothetical protein
MENSRRDAVKAIRRHRTGAFLLYAWSFARQALEAEVVRPPLRLIEVFLAVPGASAG